MLKSIFNIFSKKKTVPEETSKMSLEVAIMMNKLITQGYYENWSAATHSMLSILNNTVRHSVRSDHTVEIIVLGEGYLINKSNFRTSRVVSVLSKNEGKSKRLRLEISLNNPSKKGTTITLLITPESFNGLYIIDNGSKIDISGTIPDCKSFIYICDVFDAINSKKNDTLSTRKDNRVLEFKIPENRRVT